VSEEVDRYTGVEVIELSDKISTVKDGLAYLGCKVIHAYDMPNSTLMIAEVVFSKVISDEAPLVHFNREYYGLED
jgi:flavin reductase (DIM6/NTAB) family NADH-FMN oxidoreductase RutF